MGQSRSGIGKRGVHLVWEIKAGVQEVVSTVVFHLSRVLEWVEALRRDMGGEFF